MADQKPQPMVTVKKPDGTFVKVPLSELKKQTAPAPVQSPKPQPTPKPAPAPQPPRQMPPKPSPKPTPAPAPVKPVAEKISEQPKAPAPIAPKPQLQIKQAPKPKQWTREDSKSPLEEKPFANSPFAPAVSQQREGQVDEVIKKLGFTVAPDIQNRLRSVIQLRLKDLRTEDETRETCQRPAREGGLDLSVQQAEKLVKICDEVMMGPAKEELPSTATPFNAFVHKKQEPIPVRAQKETAEITGKEPLSETPFKISSQPAVKPTMRDIAPPPAEMGPVDEIKFISLVDFRRLSAKPDEAAKRLRQKLYNLQDESILLYMDALDAYHRSPLHVDYVKLVCASLANRKPLEAMTQDKNRMQMSEIKALVEMEKGL
jgi:hypothetical protein